MKLVSVGFVIIGFILMYFSREGLEIKDEDFIRYSGLQIVSYVVLAFSVLTAIIAAWMDMKKAKPDHAKAWLWHWLLILVASMVVCSYYGHQQEMRWLIEGIKDGTIDPGTL